MQTLTAEGHKEGAEKHREKQRKTDSSEIKNQSFQFEASHIYYTVVLCGKKCNQNFIDFHRSEHR